MKLNKYKIITEFIPVVTIFGLAGIFVYSMTEVLNKLNHLDFSLTKKDFE